MKIYLHTIALEPARWTAQRVSQNLIDLLPVIAEAGFPEVEVFEPHLTSETTSGEIRDAFARFGITPVILSSYLNMNPAGVVCDGIQLVYRLVTHHHERAVRGVGDPVLSMEPA